MNYSDFQWKKQMYRGYVFQFNNDVCIMCGISTNQECCEGFGMDDTMFERTNFDKTSLNNRIKIDERFINADLSEIGYMTNKEVSKFDTRSEKEREDYYKALGRGPPMDEGENEEAPYVDIMIKTDVKEYKFRAFNMHNGYYSHSVVIVGPKTLEICI